MRERKRAWRAAGWMFAAVVILGWVATAPAWGVVYGDDRSKRYHAEDCPEVQDIPKAYLKIFQSEAQAGGRGFYPHAQCITPMNRDVLEDRDSYRHSRPVFRNTFSEGDRAMTQGVPLLASARRLRFTQDVQLEPEVVFDFETWPKAIKWRLRIQDRENGRAVRTLAGLGALPGKVIWDGREQEGRVADMRRAYDYELLVVDRTSSEIALTKPIKSIEAWTVQAPEGKLGLAIPVVLFAYNKAALRQEGLDIFRKAAEILGKYYGYAKVVCEGHCDDTGSTQYNLKLSRERAQAVAQFLQEQPGVQPNSVTWTGYGETRPRVPGKSEYARRLNRRVEIKILLPEDQALLPGGLMRPEPGRAGKTGSGADGIAAGSEGGPDRR